MFRHIFFLLIVTICGVYGQNECSRYYQDGGVCANYISGDSLVGYAKGQSISGIENYFQSLAIAQGLSTLRSEDLLNSCVQDFTSFICATAFPKCDKISDTQGNIVPPCLSTCTNVKSSCEANLQNAPTETKGIVAKYIQSSTFYPKNCTGNISTSPPLNFSYPTEGCNNSPQLSIHPKCFKPLVEDIKWVESNKNSTLNSEFCQNGCCLPCPQSYALYPPGQMEKGFLATQILRTLSAIGSGIMLISYMILPEKRVHPSIMILFASISIFLYSSNVYFSILNPKLVQCAINEITPSTQSNNPFFCGFQGALLIFSSFATSIWIAFIILNLHIHTVWNSNIISDKYMYINMIGWGVPALLTVITLGTNSIDYQFATLCFVNVDNANAIFFYPLAFIVVPSFLLHVSTFIYIYKISNQEELSSKSGENEIRTEYNTRRRHVLQAIKIQWRALLLAIILLSTVIFYWLFYFIELNKIVKGTKNRQFVEDWTVCIQSANGQDYCARNIASNFMPSYGLMFATEISTSLIGVYLIVIFFNRALWVEWTQWFSEKFGSKQTAEQFFAI